MEQPSPQAYSEVLNHPADLPKPKAMMVYSPSSLRISHNAGDKKTQISPPSSMHRTEPVCRSRSEEDCRHIVRHVHSSMRLPSPIFYVRMTVDSNERPQGYLIVGWRENAPERFGVLHHCNLGLPRSQQSIKGTYHT